MRGPILIAVCAYLEGREAADVLWDFSQLVCGQVQLHHAGPCPEVQRQRRQLVVLIIQGEEKIRPRYHWLFHLVLGSVLLAVSPHLHVELAEDFGAGEDAEGDLVDAVVLHVQRVDGGELRRPAHRVRLETVACERQAGQVH